MIKVCAISDGCSTLYIDPAVDLSYGIEEIENLMTELPAGDKITIEILEMLKEEFRALPEFMGW